MPTRPSIARLASSAGVVSLVLLSSVALASPASAATTDETGAGPATHGLKGRACVVAARAWTDQAVAKRLVRLDRLENGLDVAVAVADRHRAALQDVYATDRAGLRAVRKEVRQDSTCAEAKTDAKKVVTKFRVYVLVTPQTTLVVRGDHGVARADGLEALEEGYTEAVAALPDGDVRTAAQAALADLVTSVDAAQASYGGIADSVLALVPADFPSSTAVLEGAAADARAGRAALAQAAAARATLELLLG